MTFVLPDRKRIECCRAAGNTEREFIPSINKHAIRNVFLFFMFNIPFFNCNKEALAYLQTQLMYAALLYCGNILRHNSVIFRPLTFKRRIKSHPPFEGIIRNSSYSTSFHDKC